MQTLFEGNTFYRVKSVDKSGEIKYSQVVKVHVANAKSQVTATVSEGQSNTITLVFKNADKGNDAISLINSAGQKVYEGSMSSTGGTITNKIRVKQKLATGIYQLQVSIADKRQNISLLVR